MMSEVQAAPLTAALPVAAPAAQRLAARALQVGAVAVVLASSTLTDFDLDRFLVPKELVLHLTAFIAGLLVLRAMARTAGSRVDLLLTGWVALNALSAVFATNHWLGFRAFAVTASGLVVFWAAGALREEGLQRTVIAGIALAVTLAAITALAQAYGLRLDVFTTSRAPGGTLGNRNFIAHAAAFGLPAVVLAAVRGRTRRSFLIGSAGVAIVAAAVVLTRSRAAWLATAAVLAVLLFAMFASAAVRRVSGRVLVIALFAGAGVAAALLIPNTLRWRSDNPYLESLKGVAAYDEGSGHGRLLQYARSLAMAAHHPLFGAGPGNWPVDYPDHAARHDASLDPSSPGMTYNPWPSSDWIGFIAERGLAAAVLLGLALLAIAGAAFRRLRAPESDDDALLATALLGTIAGAVVAGAFDAVLLLAHPTLLVWATLGALSTRPPLEGKRRIAFVPLLLVLLAGAGAARSAAQITAMQIYSNQGDRRSLEGAARIDPGNYSVQLRLARGGKRRCEHALAARALFPNAEAARAAARGCR